LWSLFDEILAEENRGSKGESRNAVEIMVEMYLKKQYWHVQNRFIP